MDVDKWFVTLAGECFEADFEREERHGQRAGSLHLFRLRDVRSGRGERLVTLFRSDQIKLLNPNYTARVEFVRINIIRRAFDSGKLSFDEPYDEHISKPLEMNDSDFNQQPLANDPEIRQFIIHKAYWLSYRHPTHPGLYPVSFDTPEDLDYLGASQADIRRNVFRLHNQEMLDKVMERIGRATEKLITAYESKQGTSIGSELLFAKDTQYEAYKVVSTIFKSAHNDIFVTDNYLDATILDMLASTPCQPSVRLLTFKPSADFRLAVKKFQSQYNRTVEVRLHQKEIHDRAIIVDDKEFYAFGASIKDLGRQLSLVNKLEDPANITKLRTELQTIWASAQLL